MYSENESSCEKTYDEPIDNFGNNWNYLTYPNFNNSSSSKAII